MGVQISVPLAPAPASRPRVTRWGTYYAKTYKNWMAEAAALIPEPAEKFDGPLIVQINLYCRRPKTTKLSIPRGDVDNYAKAVLDALTKAGYWTDDDQITYLIVSKQYETADIPASFDVSIRRSGA